VTVAVVLHSFASSALAWSSCSLFCHQLAGLGWSQGCLLVERMCLYLFIPVPDSIQGASALLNREGLNFIPG
jgi:hypothetical protein